MDYTRCVAHTLSGANKGSRCKNKGAYNLFGRGSGLKVCRTHYSHYPHYIQPWLKDLAKRSILGRYKAPV